MILTDIEKFTDFIPTAAGSDLNELKPFVDEAEFWLKNELLGYPLYYRIQQFSENPPHGVFDNTFDYTFDESIAPSDILKTAQLVVCLKAYASAIPFVDLIQTANGFAVVSNTNQAPASKERVERLIQWVDKRLSDALDNLILFAFCYSEFRQLWQQEKALFDTHTEIVFLTSNELRRYSGNKSAGFKDLDICQPTVLYLQSELANHISVAYMDELLEKRKNAQLNEFDRYVFRSVQAIAGLMFQKAPHYPLVEKLINYMLNNPDHFPTYLSSQEYALKTAPKYENKKRDSTFFFGG
ncbi:hypothetical protein FACS1894145_4390 [Bacteroidia bacterium]|nr:hypothetical protein FACS1894145_4390 [Bacteroidia bacterium]